ncbi:M15 family metallopeptidase [bacterium]|nr:M15 family metallopeptidase [bacterium]
MQQMATLPEPQRSEVAALRESVTALGDEGNGSFEATQDKVNAYLESHPDLTFTEANEMFGPYGAAALAAAQGEDVAQMINDEVNGGDELNNQKAEIFMQGVSNYAMAQADNAVAAHSANGEDGAEWLANGVGAEANEARNWQALGLDADKAVQVATTDATKGLLDTIGRDIVAMYVEGDIEGLNEDLLNRLAQVGEILGVQVHVTSGFRSYEEQVALYNAYLNGTGNLAAKPGTSRHESGLAADCAIGGMNIGDYPGAIDAMREVGLGLPVGGEAWHVEISDSFRGAN